MDGQTPVLLASNNPHKHAELRALLEPYGFGVVTPDDLGLAVAVDETGVTFAENAVLKAEAFCAASGLPSLADDSGLVVDALGGEPGIHSARYGGPGLTDKDRTALVLTRMRSISDHERQAAFVAAVAVAVPRAGRRLRLWLRPHLFLRASRHDLCTSDSRGEGGGQPPRPCSAPGRRVPHVPEGERYTKPIERTY
jgi:non-canonical purine NTP pyrophosphatase (RdgB/HAM1 family)